MFRRRSRNSVSIHDSAIPAKRISGSGRGLAVCLPGLALFALACSQEADQGAVSSASDEAAVEIWAHPDTLGIDVYAPLDLKASSRTVVWGIDGVARGIMRYQASQGESGVFGFQDRPPVEVVSPARLAIAENTGVFVFDDSTGMLDLYSPGGQHLRGFDPDLRPSILEISRFPLRLTYGMRTFGEDTIPTLAVIQTDFLGQDPDTLLSPDVGPESLRHAPAVRGSLVATPSMSGLWLFAKAMSDTVFEVSGVGPSRKLVLPETDTLRAGVIADLQQQILWVVTPRPTGGLDYEGYDISDSGDGAEIIDGATAYLGPRSTPQYFAAKVAFDGTVSGWWRSERGVFAPRGYDMRIDDLRAGAARGTARYRPSKKPEKQRVRSLRISVRGKNSSRSRTVRVSAVRPGVR